MAPLVLMNGKIVTVDEQFSIVQALAIEGGRITATGSNADVIAAAGQGAEVVDLTGRTVIPGLIDNHNHFVRASEYAEVRLEGIRSRADALAALRRGAAALPPGQWLLVLGGWHEEQWAGDRRELTVAEIDAVTGDRPAFIMAEYDHAVVNTAWLDAAAVSAAAETRATGRIGGGIVALNRAVAGFPGPADREATARAVMSWYNSVGLTTVFDPGGVGVPDAAYARLSAMAGRGELTLRVLTTLGDGANGRGAEHAAALCGRIRQARPFDGDHWYDRIAVGEVYYAAFHWDHPGISPDPSAEDIAHADAILAAAAESGWPVQTHSVTTAGLDLVFDAYERADARRPIRPLRWSVTHGEGITPAHLERARRLGVTVQLRSMGVIRAGRPVVAPLRLLADSGLSWGLGTDGTRAAQINPFVTLWWAVTGQSLGGAQILDDPLTREEALIAHTRSNAHLIFRENQLGSLRPGLLADLLVLDRDYLTVPADQIRDIVPVATLVDGRVVHGKIPAALVTGWFAVGVVGVDPGVADERVDALERRVARLLSRAVREVVEVSAGMADFLEAGGARNALGLVAAQGGGRVSGVGGQAAGEDGRVLDGLRGALAEEREHGVGGVAQQGDRAGAPRGERRAVEQCPAARSARGGDQVGEPPVPALELGEKLADRRGRRP